MEELMAINKENDRLLKILSTIESGIAKIYKRFSAKKNFGKPVQKFWQYISKEEELHAEYFEKIRKGMNTDNIPVKINIDIERLKEFVNKVNRSVKDVMTEEYSESDAYSLGASIEVEMDESRFLEGIEITDQKFTRMLKKIENDTEKHRIVLVNYSRGIK